MVQVRSHPKLTYEVGYAAMVLAAVALALSPVLRRSGFPLNQGTTGPLLLVQMYAAHFRHLDFFPIWSSTDGTGMGSPVLLYYHHLFFYVAGITSALGGGLKEAVVATIALFLVAGAYGMRCALGIVTDRKVLCIAGSVGFLFTNYVFTDWLDPRGDLAEFAALMIVPWLLYWCLTLVALRRASFSLIPVMVLLVFAHTAIAFTSLFILVIALIIFTATAGFRGLRSIMKRLLVCVIGTALLLAPLLLAQLRFNGAYDPAHKNKLSATIWLEFLGFGRYLIDTSHQWFAHNQVPPFLNFAQIDFAIWIPIVAAVAAAVAYGVLRCSMYVRLRVLSRGIAARSEGSGTPQQGSGLLKAAGKPSAVFLLLTFAFYLFMQLKISFFVYHLVTPLQVINFPWRMLAYITPLGIALVVVISDNLIGRFRHVVLWRTAAAAWVASLVLLSPVMTSSGFEVTSSQFAPMSVFQVPQSIDYRTFDGYVTYFDFPPGPLYGIFLPKVYGPNGQEIASVQDNESLYARLHRSQSGAQSLSHIACQVLGPQHAEFETLQLTFSVKCRGATRLALPVSYNDYSSVFVLTHGGRMRKIPYLHVRTDPRIVINVTSSDPETVIVHLPTLWGTLF